MKQGIVIAGVSSFYDIMTDEGVVRCKARGSFRQEKKIPVIGDRVTYSDKGYLERIEARTSYLIRPPVANADQAMLVMAVHAPEPNWHMLDRLLAEVSEQSIVPILIFNKCDLIGTGDGCDTVRDVMNIYRSAGYTVRLVSAYTGEGLEDLRSGLAGHLTVLAGPSGVGKSSLLNALIPGLHQETGKLSEKIERGRNTTRHARLIPLEGGGYVADTPGFTSLYLGHVDYRKLETYYPEFEDYRQICYFTGCSHITEPGCAVRQAVEDGVISKLRYENYVSLYQEIKQENKENEYT